MGICAAAFIAAACGPTGQAGARWAGTVTEENGIRTVRNPKKPIYGEFTLDLESDLIIGGDGDDNTIFYEARRMAVDGNGNMYVLDSGNHRIQKFDDEGNYLQTIGKEGQGPGEFENLSAIFLAGDGTFYVTDGMRMQRFKQDGTFLSSIPLTNRITDFWVAPEKRIFGVEVRNTEQGRHRHLVKLDPEGKEEEALADYADVQAVDRENEGVRMRFVIMHRYNPILYLTPSPGGGFFYTHSAEYNLYHCNARGETDLIIKKVAEPVPITRQEKDRIIRDTMDYVTSRGRNIPEDIIRQGCRFPSTAPYFVAVVVDDRGRLYVRRLKSSLDESDTQVLDIFGPEGHYLYQVTTAVRPSVITDGWLYELWEDEEEGLIQLRRHRINNWDALKLGLE
jgi:hypothetical protein